MYAVKLYASGDTEAVKLPDREYGQDFVREHVGGMPDCYTNAMVFKSFPAYLSMIYIRKQEGIRAKENKVFFRFTGKKAVGDVLILPGISPRHSKGFSIEEATKVIEELQKGQEYER